MKKLFNDKYLKIMLFTVGCVVVTSLFLSLLLNFGSVIKFFNGAIAVLSPVLYAIVAVLLINPSVHLFDEKLFPFVFKRAKKDRPKLRRALSVVCAYLLFTILFLAVVVIVIVPVTENAGLLQTKIPGAIRSTVSWIEKTIDKYEFLAPQKEEIMAHIENSFIFSPSLVQNLVGKILSYTTTIVSETFSVIVGVIISIYIIVSMDSLKALRDKIIAAYLSDELSLEIRHCARETYRVFSDFFIGRLMYSITIGIAFFYVLYFADVPFYSVISIAMGIVAFVPVCGTVLSYVVGVCLCLLFDPQDAALCALIFFALFLAGRLLLQPNLIKKSVTASVGLAIVSVLVSYALFDVVGALIAVPVFICFKRFIIHMMNRRKLKMADTGSSAIAE
jgi:predicted PurR-regulated permease PerM